MNTSQKEQLFSTLAEAMQGVPERIGVRQLVQCYKADPDYGRGVTAKLGLDMKKYTAWAKLALQELIKKASEENYGRQTHRQMLSSTPRPKPRGSMKGILYQQPRLPFTGEVAALSCQNDAQAPQDFNEGFWTEACPPPIFEEVLEIF